MRTQQREWAAAHHRPVVASAQQRLRRGRCRSAAGKQGFNCQAWHPNPLLASTTQQALPGPLWGSSRASAQRASAPTRVIERTTRDVRVPHPGFDPLRGVQPSRSSMIRACPEPTLAHDLQTSSAGTAVASAVPGFDDAAAIRSVTAFNRRPPVWRAVVRPARSFFAHTISVARPVRAKLVMPPAPAVARDPRWS